MTASDGLTGTGSGKAERVAHPPVEPRILAGTPRDRTLSSPATSLPQRFGDSLPQSAEAGSPPARSASSWPSSPSTT